MSSTCVLYFGGTLGCLISKLSYNKSFVIDIAVVFTPVYCRREGNLSVDA